LMRVSDDDDEEELVDDLHWYVLFIVKTPWMLSVIHPQL
jgi:hypothetical protein